MKQIDRLNHTYADPRYVKVVGPALNIANRFSRNDRELFEDCLRFPISDINNMISMSVIYSGRQ